MILAAGLGTRMRPMTEALPKPLLPIANRPLLVHHLELLRSVGVREVMLNLHHLPEALPKILGDGRRFGLRLHYHHEPEILGTGGGIKAVETFLGGEPEPFWVLNGDLLIEVSLRDVLAVHLEHRPMATMVLRDDVRADRFGAIGVDSEYRIVDFVGRARAPGEVVREGLFTGIHLLEPEVLSLLPPDQACCINRTAYPAMINAGNRVQAYFQSGFWSDVGTPERYLEANLAVLEGRARLAGHQVSVQDAEYSGPDPRVSLESGGDGKGIRFTPPCLIDESATIEHEAQVGPLVCVGAGARVGRGARVSRSVVWAGARVEDGTDVHDAIAWVKDGETRVFG